MTSFICKHPALWQLHTENKEKHSKSTLKDIKIFSVKTAAAQPVKNTTKSSRRSIKGAVSPFKVTFGTSKIHLTFLNSGCRHSSEMLHNWTEGLLPSAINEGVLTSELPRVVMQQPESMIYSQTNKNIKVLLLLWGWVFAAFLDLIPWQVFVLSPSMENK